MDALIERNYETTLKTVKTLVEQTNVSLFLRMAMFFQACRDSSMEFLKRSRDPDTTDVMPENAQAQAYIHQKYLKHVISELKPALTEVIQQGINNGEIHFDYPAELAEIVLIVIAVKMDNTLIHGKTGMIHKHISRSNAFVYGILLHGTYLIVLCSPMISTHKMDSKRKSRLCTLPGFLMCFWSTRFP